MDDKEKILKQINNILKERDEEYLETLLEGLEIDEEQGVFEDE